LARHQDDLRIIASADALIDEIARGNCATLVLNPVLFRADVIDAILRSIRNAGTSLVLFVPNELDAIATVSRNVGYVPFEMILEGALDEHRILARLVDSPGHWSVPARVLHSLGPELRRLPLPIAGSFVRFLAWHPISATAEEFYSTLETPRRTSERWLQRCGFSDATLVLTCCRLARAWEIASRRDVTKAFVANNVGWRSTRTLDSQARRVMGYTLARARSLLDDQQVAELITCSMKRISDLDYMR
jgi:hypothetical protein